MASSAFYKQLAQNLCARHKVGTLSDIKLFPHIAAGNSLSPATSKQYVFRMALVLPANEPFTKCNEYASVPFLDFAAAIKAQNGIDLALTDMTRARVIDLKVLHGQNATSGRLGIASNIAAMEQGQQDVSEFDSNTVFHGVIKPRSDASAEPVVRSLFCAPAELEYRRDQFRQWGATRGLASLINGTELASDGDTLLVPADSLLLELMALEPSRTAEIKRFGKSDGLASETQAAYFLLSKQQVEAVLGTKPPKNALLKQYLQYDRSLIDLTKLEFGLVAMDEPEDDGTPITDDSIVSFELTVALQTVRDSPESDAKPVLVLRDGAVY